MIGNKEMIGTIRGGSTVYFGLSTYFLHFIPVSIDFFSVTVKCA